MANEYNPETNELDKPLCEGSDNLEAAIAEPQWQRWQIPANQVVAEFGEVNVRRIVANDGNVVCRVEVTIAMEPQGQFAEGWRTGVALDGSASMKRAYGRKVEARVDPVLLTDYIKQGRLKSYLEDGEPIRRIEREAFAELQAKGYEINYTANILQPLVQDFMAYLAGSLDGMGRTALIYWGCGKGDEIQVLGEFDAVGCQSLPIAGPATVALGKSTQLLPAIAYFTKQYEQAKRGMFIFLTDGRINDLAAVKSYTRQLALEIATGKRNFLKLVLIGIGQDVDRYQLQELDDFDTGLDIDIWDYKIASEMSNLTQIFAEVVNENMVIAAGGKIYDDRGNCVKSYGQGLPAYLDFIINHDARWFELEVNGQRIRQNIWMESAAIAPLAPKTLMDFELQAIASRDQVAQGVALENAQTFDNNQGALTEPSTDVQRKFKYWKLLAAFVIGLALLGTAIAFGILMGRSDDRNGNNNENLNKNINGNTNKNTSENIDTNGNSNAVGNRNGKVNNANSKSINNGNALTNKLPNVPSPQAQDSPQTSAKPTKSKSPAPSSSPAKPNPTPIATALPKAPATPAPSPSTPTNTSSASAPISDLTLPITDPDVETTIFFAADEAIVSEKEFLKIEQFWQKIQGKTGIIRVSGHTDRTGEYAYNLDISKERANEVVRLLRDRGVDSNYKITFEALSWLQPQTTSTNPNLNRRVVIQFKEANIKQ